MPSLARLLSNFVVLTFVVGYILFMLATECMPVADTDRVVHAIPRWEFWLIQASFPDILWMQWTGGNQPVSIADRVPILLGAFAWLATSAILGRAILSIDRIEPYFAGWTRTLLATTIGHAALSSIVFLHGIFIGTQSRLTLVISILALLGFTIWQSLIARNKTPSQTITHTDTPNFTTTQSERETDSRSDAGITVDTSFDTAWSRRLIGLLAVAIFWIVSIIVYAAPIPSNDVYVREVEMMAVKEFHRTGALTPLEYHTQSNEPKGLWMPASAMATLLIGPVDAEATWTEHQSSQLFNAIAIGKTINATLPVFAALLVGFAAFSRWGTLAGLVTILALTATPGMIELGRLGRTEAALSVWAVAFCVLFQQIHRINVYDLSANTKSGWICSFILLSAVISSGYACAVLVGIPCSSAMIYRAYFLLKHQKGQNKLTLNSSEPKTVFANAGQSTTATYCIAVVAIAFCFSWYIRNAIKLGDPITPWTSACLAPTKTTEPDSQTIRATNADNPTSGASLSHSIHRDRWWANQFALLSKSTTEVHTDHVNTGPDRANSATKSDLHTEETIGGVERTFDALSRLFIRSNAHGLILIPLSVLGIFRVLQISRSNSSMVAFWAIAAWAFYWIAAWLLASPQMDRDWVGMLPLLAWFAPAGINILKERFGGLLIAPLVLVAIVWSVVAIAVWPMCDNRIFVSLNTMRDSYHEPTEPPRYQAHINQMLRDEALQSDPSNMSASRYSPPRILIVGDSDTVELNARTITNGTYDKGLWDSFHDKTSNEIAEMLKENQVSHVILSWTGVRDRESQIQLELEKGYREILAKTLTDGVMTPLRWPLLSSDAELFKVNGQLTTDIIEPLVPIR